MLFILIDMHVPEQQKHMTYVRQLIDSTDQKCHNRDSKQFKYFVMFIHSPAQTIYHCICFPAIFLHQWDFHFFDTCATGNAFHLQKMLQTITCSSDETPANDKSDLLCDLSILFEDSLWDICSRIQLVLPEFPEQMFSTKKAYEFYRSQTTTFQRVQYLREILKETSDIQKLIIHYYHQYIFNEDTSTKKMFDFIYEIAKDIIAGKRFDGLVESIQNQMRSSLTDFLSFILKIILNDYGLETLPKLSTNHEIYGKLLSLVDFESFFEKKNNRAFSHISSTQGCFSCFSHYSVIPQTPFFHLFHQRIQAHADKIKQNHLIDRHALNGRLNQISLSDVDRVFISNCSIFYV